MSNLDLNYILWEMPVAITYQLQLLYYQRQGNKFYRKYRADVKALTTFLS